MRYLVVLFMALAFVGCDKERTVITIDGSEYLDPPRIDINELYGTWDYTIGERSIEIHPNSLIVTGSDHGNRWKLLFNWNRNRHAFVNLASKGVIFEFKKNSEDSMYIYKGRESPTSVSRRK